MIRRKPETPAQRHARVEQYNAWAMRTYARMGLEGEILRSNPAFQAIIEYDTAMLDEENPAIIAELKTRFTKQDREDYMNALTSPTRYLMVRDAGKAATLLLARFPRDLANPEAALEFFQFCRSYDLDPFLGEVIPYQGRPYVTQLGWEAKVDTLCAGEMVEYNARLATPEEYEARHVPKEDVLAFGWCVRLLPNGRARRMEGWGIVTQDEYTGAKIKPENRGYTPVEKDAPSMAEKRGRFKALRLNFADVFKRVGLPTDPRIDSSSIDGEVVTADGELWDAATGEAKESQALDDAMYRATVQVGLEELSQELHAATAEPAPEAGPQPGSSRAQTSQPPVPAESKADMAMSLQRKRFQGGNAAWQAFVRECIKDAAEQHGMMGVSEWDDLNETGKIAVGKHLKARLDAAEKPAPPPRPAEGSTPGHPNT